MNTVKEIIDQNYTALCNYSQVIVKDHHATEDIVQTVFIQLWEDQKITHLEDPEPYLIRCVKYKCLDYLNRPIRKREISSDTLPELIIEENPTFSEKDILPMLLFFADKLPPKMRQVFLLSRQGGKSYKEIANELNISVKTVENQMGSALKK